jgi:hypothetical protein
LDDPPSGEEKLWETMGIPRSTWWLKYAVPNCGCFLFPSLLENAVMKNKCRGSTKMPYCPKAGAGQHTSSFAKAWITLDNIVEADMQGLCSMILWKHVSCCFVCVVSLLPGSCVPSNPSDMTLQ